MSNREKNIPIRHPDPFRTGRSGATATDSDDTTARPDEDQVEREVTDGGGEGFMLFLFFAFLALIVYLLW